MQLLKLIHMQPQTQYPDRPGGSEAKNGLTLPVCYDCMLCGSSPSYGLHPLVDQPPLGRL
jgi:hypothetical protein